MPLPMSIGDLAILFSWETVIVLRAEVMADHGRDTEDGEKVGRDHFGAQALRFVGAGKIEIVGATGCDPGEPAVIPLSVEKIGIVDGLLCKGQRAGVKRYRRSGCGYGKGLSSTPFTTEKKAVFAPIFSANVRIRNFGESRGLRYHAIRGKSSTPVT
jgi:hypothetical protein